jgi:hypothetical protein
MTEAERDQQLARRTPLPEDFRPRNLIARLDCRAVKQLRALREAGA